MQIHLKNGIFEHLESPFQHQHNLALAAAAAVAAQQRHIQQQQLKQTQQKNSVDHHHQNLMDQDGNNLHMYFETKSESGSEILSRPPTPNSSSYSINDMINQQIESIPINNIANISGGGGGSQNESSNRGKPHANPNTHFNSFILFSYFDNPLSTFLHRNGPAEKIPAK